MALAQTNVSWKHNLDDTNKYKTETVFFFHTKNNAEILSDLSSLQTIWALVAQW